MLRPVLIFLAAVASAAEPAKPQEFALKSTSLAGKESHLVATLPAGFKGEIKALSNSGSALEILRVESSDQRAQMMITLLPPINSLGRDAAGLEALLRQNSTPFIDGSVEGKVNPFPMKLANGIGVAAFFTDKSEVGKPAAKGQGHYKMLTNAVIRVGESTLAAVTIFNDTREQPDYLAAIKVVATLREGK